MPFRLLALLVIAEAGPAAAQARRLLLDQDRSVAARATAGGLVVALEEVLADSAALLYPGAPLLTGRASILSFLRAQPVLDTLEFRWEPVRGVLAKDSAFGVTWGAVVTHRRAPPTESETGFYIAVWRSAVGGWRLLALMQSGVIPAARTVVPARSGPIERPRLAPSGAAQPIIRADLDFAALAAREGAPKAFGAFAAPTAMAPAGSGRWSRGPEQVAAGIAAARPADWTWHPVLAEIAGSGDLGFTVGEAVIRPRSGGEPSYSKYLTAWQRQPDGTMRFLADGGNVRPRPQPR